MDIEEQRKQELVKTSTISDLGITSVILYSIIFSYAYLNAYYKKDGSLGLSILNPKKGFTVTHAIYNSEKIGIGVFTALYVILTTYILYKQNFIKSFMGVICIIINISFGFILAGFTYISYEYTALHLIMGAAMFIGGQTFSFLTLMLYDDSYQNDDISEITTLVYMLTVVFIVLLLLISFNGYNYYGISEKQRKKKTNEMTLRVSWDIMGFLEIIHLLLFVTLMYYISVYPPLITPENS